MFTCVMTFFSFNNSFSLKTNVKTTFPKDLVLVNACLRVHYEIYFSSHFLFVVIRTSACASANDRKENDEKNKSHNARETCVNWVIA